MEASDSNIAEPVVYTLSFIQQLSRSRQKVPCPVEDCCYSESTAADLKQHFFNHHYTYRLHI